MRFLSFALSCVLTNVCRLGELPSKDLGLCNRNIDVESCTRVGQKISLQCMYFGFFFSPSSASNTTHLIVLVAPLLVRTSPAATEVFVTSWNERLYFLLTSVSVLCYQPSCHNCVPLAIVFKCVVAKILFQRWTQIIARRRITDDHNQSRFCFHEVVRHVSLFADRFPVRNTLPLCPGLRASADVTLPVELQICYCK